MRLDVVGIEWAGDGAAFLPPSPLPVLCHLNANRGLDAVAVAEGRVGATPRIRLRKGAQRESLLLKPLEDPLALASTLCCEYARSPETPMRRRNALERNMVQRVELTLKKAR